MGSKRYRRLVSALALTSIFTSPGCSAESSDYKDGYFNITMNNLRGKIPEVMIVGPTSSHADDWWKRTDEIAPGKPPVYSFVIAFNPMTGRPMTAHDSSVWDQQTGPPIWRYGGKASIRAEVTTYTGKDNIQKNVLNSYVRSSESFPKAQQPFAHFNGRLGLYMMDNGSSVAPNSEAAGFNLALMSKDESVVIWCDRSVNRSGSVPDLSSCRAITNDERLHAGFRIHFARSDLPKWRDIVERVKSQTNTYFGFNK